MKIENVMLKEEEGKLLLKSRTLSVRGLAFCGARLTTARPLSAGDNPLPGLLSGEELNTNGQGRGRVTMLMAE